MARRGYWGDLINSPYLAFGIESEEKSLFEKKNKMHIKVETITIVFTSRLITVKVEKRIC